MKKSARKIISMFLAIIMLVVIVPTADIGIKAYAVTGNEVVAYARQFIGYPYVWGTQGPNSFDCSGFVHYVFKHFGMNMPAGSSYYWNNPTAYGTVIDYGSTSKAQAGDIISWSGHVAIYTENGLCIEALNPSYGVCERFKVDSHTNGLNYKVIRPNYTGSSDTTPPKITNSYVSDISDKGFSINATLSDNVGISRGWIVIYSPSGEHQFSIAASSGHFSYRIDTSKYGGSGNYSIHLYIFDYSENSTLVKFENIKVTSDKTAPTVSNCYVSNVSSNSFTINAILSDNIGISRGWIVIYSPSGEHQFSILATSGQFSYKVDTSKYGGSGNYTIHLYIIDYSENSTLVKFNNIKALDAKRCLVTFNSNGGFCSTSSKTVTYGSTYGTLPTPTKSGYTFGGWYTSISGGTKVTASTKVNKTSNHTLYAHWISNHSHSYTLKSTSYPTCTEIGKKTYACSCGASYTETISALGHSYATAAVKATLAKDGSTVTQCTTCGEIKTKSSIPRVSSVYLTNTVFSYSGNILRPSVIVKDRTGKTLKNGTDYTVKYSSGCKKAGQYTVTVTFKGKYAGTKTLTYRILPKGTSISKLTAGKKQFTAKWSAQTAQTTGYELQYSTKSSMSGAKTVTVGKTKTTSSTVKKIKGKKKYYVRIRTYKTVKIGGKSVKLYSAWSKVKSVKTK